MKDYLVLDIETTSLNPRKGEIVGLAWYCSKTNNSGYTNKQNQIKELCELPCDKIFHNATFDLGFLKHKGYNVLGEIHDTMLLAHLYDPDQESLKLKELSTKFLSDKNIKHAKLLWAWLEANNLSKEDISRAPYELLKNYAIEDVLNTWELFKLFTGKLEKIGEWLKERKFVKVPLDYYKEEIQPLIPVIVAMEARGVKLDLEQAALKKEELYNKSIVLKNELNLINTEAITEIEKQLYEEEVKKRIAKNKSGKLKKQPPKVFFNWDSSNHLKQLFFGLFKLKPTKKTLKGNASIDAAALNAYVKQYPWIDKLLEYKEIQKLYSTYLNNLLDMQEGGRIYAKFHLSGTATGRLASSNPNLQNLPKHGEIKRLFIPNTLHSFIYADYSQLELRIAAHLSQDKLLLQAYNEGLDLHKLTADTIGVTRDLGKTINFAIIYNASGWRIAEILGYMANIDLEDIDAKKRAAKKGDDLIKTLFSKYSGLKRFLDRTTAQMMQYKMTISEFGRIRRLPEINSSDRKIRNHELKAGFNLPIQSFGASLTKRAMIQLHSKGAKIVNQIHDAIIIEVDTNKIESAKAHTKQIMENIYKLSVPLVAEPKILTSFEEK